MDDDGARPTVRIELDFSGTISNISRRRGVAFFAFGAVDHELCDYSFCVASFVDGGVGRNIVGFEELDCCV
jgi:hypothetical protein